MPKPDHIEQYTVQLATITAHLSRLGAELADECRTYEADLLERARRLVGDALEDLELELARLRVED